MLNEVIIIGRIGNEAEISETKNGTKVARIRVSLYHSYTRENQKTQWISVEALGNRANVLEVAQKGTLVAVKGELYNDTWQDEKGNWNTRTYILLDTFKFLEKKKEIGERSGNQDSAKVDGKKDEVKEIANGYDDHNKTQVGSGGVTMDDIDDLLDNL